MSSIHPLKLPLCTKMYEDTRKVLNAAIHRTAYCLITSMQAIYFGQTVLQFRMTFFKFFFSSFLYEIFKGVVHMKTLLVNEVAFVSGGDGGSCPAAGPSAGCYTAPPSGCTTTTTNGPTLGFTITAGSSGISVTASASFAPATTTCPATIPTTPTPGSGSTDSGGPVGDWFQSMGPMVYANPNGINPLLMTV